MSRMLDLGIAGGLFAQRRVPRLLIASLGALVAFLLSRTVGMGGFAEHGLAAGALRDRQRGGGGPHRGPVHSRSPAGEAALARRVARG